MKRGAPHAVVWGLAAGLAAAPLLELGSSRSAQALAWTAAGAVLIAVVRDGAPAARVARIGAAFLLAMLAGLAIGALRVESIAGEALRGSTGQVVEAEGHVSSQPRRDRGSWSFGLDTPNGRVQLRAAMPDPPAVGAPLRVRGRLQDPPPWLREALRRRGIASVLDAERIEPGDRGRGGLAGGIDEIRMRAEAALGRGMPEREAALARGFVLGQDEAIDGATRDDFRRSGLAHLLAVSGQNVLLLCLLAWPLLAVLGLTLRARLGVLLALIAVYVPVTGAGPSIQRAGVMGAAGVIAALAERPASRWYALGLAAALTLAVNPLAAGDVGWQLSFAAVAGILMWTSRLAALLAGGAGRGTPRRALADGIAMTAAATVATGPLMAHHFDALPLAALPANLLALPAVAPAMWLGMLAGIAGQLPSLPVEPLNWLNALCLGYIAQVGRWLAAPDWALLELRLAGPVAVASAYAALVGVAEAALAAAARRRGLAGRPARAGGRRGSAGARRRLVLAAALLAALLIPPLAPFGGGERPSDDRLRVVVLDVGQGDSILLDPPDSEPVLVDTGPPGAGIGRRLRELGVGSLAALLVTHDQADHSGGVDEVLGTVPTRRLGLGAVTRSLASVASSSGAELLPLSEGGELRSGELRISVLWPPRELVSSTARSLSAEGVDPNALSLVLLAEWRHFSILLTGDAEAEAVPIDPGPVDLLKVAHHGSEDAGLGALLDRTAPRLAVISVGEENPHGHPHPSTLAALRAHGLPSLRTDLDGTLRITADERGWRAEPGQD